MEGDDVLEVVDAAHALHQADGRNGVALGVQAGHVGVAARTVLHKLLAWPFVPWQHLVTAHTHTAYGSEHALGPSQLAGAWKGGLTNLQHLQVVALAAHRDGILRALGIAQLLQRDDLLACGGARKQSNVSAGRFHRVQPTAQADSPGHAHMIGPSSLSAGSRSW